MMGLPHETTADIKETVELLARIKPGRFRWSLFFPFVGTKAYEIAEKSGQINFDKMKKLDNFTDETCMVLGDETDLYVDKVKTMLCTFVNGYADIDGEHEYLDLVKKIEGLDAKSWHREKMRLQKEVEALDKKMEEKRKLHYTVKYNPFMGVRSDWTDNSISA
jgi:anaerobic magnesium-protoporphyrin IX monomethyl ester cyclase